MIRADEGAGGTETETEELAEEERWNADKVLKYHALEETTAATGGRGRDRRTRSTEVVGIVTNNRGDGVGREARGREERT